MRLLSRVVALLGAAVLLRSSPASAAQQAVEQNPFAPPLTRLVVLTGRVTSEAQHAVSGAEVRLLQSGSVVVDTLSDGNGVYRFTNPSPSAGTPPVVPSGSYVLEAQYRGTSRTFGTVIIRRGATGQRNIALGRIVQKGGAALTPRTTFVVTDRVAGPDPTSLKDAFKNERPVLACEPAPQCALHFGVVAVNGPLLGGVELEQNMTALITAMRAAYPGAASVTIFVHGFNNDFEEPLRMTASAVASVDPSGVPMAYSWPSKHVTARYIDDETNNAWAAEHFRDFLVALLQAPDGPAGVNIVAHSMGSRLVVSALQYVARAKPATHGHLNQVVFAAPDVDAATFWEAVPSMASAVRGLTIYGSTHDEALQVSRQLHGHCRAGLIGCDDAAVLPANVNGIDASFFHCDLLGHGYWAASTTMLSDIAAVMQAGPMTSATSVRPHLAALGTPGRYKFASAASDDSACAAEPAH